MDNDSTSSGSDIDPPVYPTGPCTQILSWPLRMKAAFAKFPVNDDPLSVHKFSQGFEWELWYVAATIGFAHLNYQQFEIPALLRKANRYTHLTYHEKQPFLHELFQSLLEVQTGSAPPGGWPNAWWEELSTASFPELTYQHHQERQRRLVERLQTLRNITQKALDKNSEHLASRASEIIQLTEGSEVIKRNVLERLGEEMTSRQMDTE